MWSAVTGLIVFLDIVWNLPQSLANSRPSQLLVELAVEIFLALSFAGLAGALVWARRNGPG